MTLSELLKYHFLSTFIDLSIGVAIVVLAVIISWLINTIISHMGPKE